MNRSVPELSKKYRNAISNSLFYILLFVILFVVLIPIIWMFLGSFKTQSQILSKSGLFWFEPTLNNYVVIFEKYDFIKPIINSFVVSFLSTFFALVLGLPAAYSVARYRLRMLGMLILVVRFIPGITFLIPWYMLFSQLGLVDTYTALSISHMLINLPFIIWVMIPYFESIPRELEEAARVDGSSVIGLFTRIMVPLAIPGIITVSLLSFIFSWNNLIFSMVLAGVKTQTLPLAILQFISYANIDWGALMAAAVIITIPILFISLITQRFVIQGLTAGAVKG